MTTVNVAHQYRAGLIGWCNGERHRTALTVFMIVVMAHMAEHVAQAYQIWVLRWPIPQAGGVLGLRFPWLLGSEWLHYGYALLTLAGLVVLRPAFVGRGRAWWTVALVIGFWHHIEHLLLLVQAQSGVFLLGRTAPISIAQLIFAPVQLHLFYNSAVFLPMVAAFYFHLRPSGSERGRAVCGCAGVGRG